MEIIQGKVKTVFPTSKPDEVIIQYEDKVTAGNGEKEDYPEGKGKICCEISAIIFKLLEQEGVDTHYVSMPTHRAMCCKKVEIIPIEVVVRNIAAGSICRQTTIPEGKLFMVPLVEFYLKDDAKNDPLLTYDRVKLMGYDPEELMPVAYKVNKILTKIFFGIGLDLVDFKIELGTDKDGKLLLADEISPDSCRLWKTGTKESFDKDLFRKGEGDIVKAYQHILNNLSK
jgi:phosphoribosylaminoimidazole-succinocarboxamide synthase|tara:strand:+ start:1976 stop:2659 length:684 start_codon:yes stop_codon:yes gene_type:complete